MGFIGNFLFCFGLFLIGASISQFLKERGVRRTLFLRAPSIWSIAWGSEYWECTRTEVDTRQVPSVLLGFLNPQEAVSLRATDMYCAVCRYRLKVMGGMVTTVGVSRAGLELRWLMAFYEDRLVMVALGGEESGVLTPWIFSADEREHLRRFYKNVTASFDNCD